jgi:hypothetical protein
MSKDDLKTGTNRTGFSLAPLQGPQMLKAVELFLPTSEGDASEIMESRIEYTQQKDLLGTVPLPATPKGALKMGIKKLTGNQPEVFIDKLGERLGFERTGVRLYDALIAKCAAQPLNTDGFSIERLVEIRNEEARHFELIHGCLETLGADPTCVTPSADVAGIEAMGLIQVLTDWRTTSIEGLHAILVAELTDHVGWELLIRLADSQGMAQMVESFRAALATEEQHLATVRGWVESTLSGLATKAA